MKEKVNIDDLYVVCKISEVIITLEPWVQYESFGKDEHRFYVKPKMHLTRKVTEENETKYQLVKTGKFIKPIEPEKSYESISSCRTTLRAYCMPEIKTGFCVNPYARDAAKDIYDDLNQYGYIMPFKEYVKNVLGIELVGPISLSKAQILLALINKRGREFRLSYNEEVASNQIQKKVRRSK